MTSPKPVDVAAILAAVYRRPSEQSDQLAERVRARLALIDTLGECVRLLVEVPASVVSASLPQTHEKTKEEEEPSSVAGDSTRVDR
jgi:hypothetical protein